MTKNETYLDKTDFSNVNDVNNDVNKSEPENSDFISQIEKEIFTEAVLASKIGKKRFA